LEKNFLGVDVGTGSVRAGIFDARGGLLGTGRCDIRIWHDAGHRVEQSSDDIWKAVCVAVRSALSESGRAPEAIAAMGFDATCSLVLLDADNRPVAAGPSGEDGRNVIVWMDHRARDQAARINVLRHEVLNYVGGRISPEMETPKILWLAEMLPHSFARTAHFFDLTDFLTFRATGSRARSLCTLACKWTYLADQGGWQPSYFREIGLEVIADEGFGRIGTQVVAPGTALGKGLDTQAAAELGLVAGTVVAAGLIDAHAGAVGTLGASGPTPLSGRLAYVFGTSACTLNVTPTPAFVPGVWGPYYEALLPGLWLNEGGQSAAGAAIEAVLALHPLAAEMAEAARTRGVSLVELVDAEAAGGGAIADIENLVRGLHILPEFLGNRAPHADPDARAMASGLGLDRDFRGLVALYLAAVASIGYGLGQIVQALSEKGVRCDLVVISGGASRSPLVRQLLADATGLAVAVSETSEPVLLGAAMLASVASGTQPNILTAMVEMSRFSSTVTPDASRRAFHAARAEIFAEMQAFQRRTRTS